MLLKLIVRNSNFGLDSALHYLSSTHNRYINTIRNLTPRSFARRLLIDDIHIIPIQNFKDGLPILWLSIVSPIIFIYKTTEAIDCFAENNMRLDSVGNINMCNI